MFKVLTSLSLTLLLLLLPRPGQADELGAALAKLHAGAAGTVVTVDYTTRITLEGLPGINAAENERTLRGSITGIVVHEGKHILISSTALAAGTQVFEILGATPRTRILGLAVNTGGGVKLAAKVAASNAKLGLMLLALDRASPVLKPVSFSERALGVGARIAVLAADARLLGSPLTVRTARIAGLSEKPQRRYLIDPPLPQANGALVYALDGGSAIAGVHAALPLATLPADGSIGRRGFEPDEVEAAARGALIPGALIGDWIKTAATRPVAAEAADFSAQRAWLGFEVQVITEELATALGLDYDGVAKIKKVYPKTPAETLGLKPEDLILQLDGESLDLAEDETFRDVVSDLGTDTEITLTVLRGEERLSLTTKLAASPKTPEEAERFPAFRHGFVIRDLTFFDTDTVGKDRRGLYVSKLTPNGQAIQAGLKIGDLITEIDGQPTETVAQARALIKADRSLALKVLRGGEELSLRIQVR